jgi:glycosyltransferase involved in cell wall biosynthesis
LWRVRAPVSYLPSGGLKAVDLWAAIEAAARVCPDVWSELSTGVGEDASDVYQALCLAEQVVLRGIRHLHAHFASSPASVARLASRFAGISYSFTAHAKDIFHEDVRADDLRAKVRDAAGAVTVSDYNLAFLGRLCGDAAEKVRRVYNGLPLDRFRFETPREREPRVVAVGRLVEKKGFADLIDACRILEESGTLLSCSIIGTGELEADLREQISRSRLEGLVELLGPRPQAEIADRVRRAAVFAAPCVVGEDGNRDGLPTTLLEAMAIGTPCVSTDVTGIPEVVRDGVTGLQVAQRDPAALASAIRRLLEDAELRVELAGNARALVESEFDVHENAARVRELFEPARAVPVRRAV